MLQPTKKPTAKTHQTIFYTTAQEYRDIVPRFYIANREGLTVNQKINMRNNLQVCGTPYADRLLLKKTY